MLNLVLRATLREVGKYNRRRYCKDTFDFLSKPVRVNTKRSELAPDRKISKDLIAYLEGISLVNFGDERGIKIVEDAVSYADQLEEVNTDGVEPLYSVIENESLYLREDVVEKDVKTNDLLSHSEKICEGYYITPLGNVAYAPDKAKDINSISTDKTDEKVEKYSQV